MTGTIAGISLVLFCAVLDGFGQVLLKKSMVAQVNWFLWISPGVLILALEALVYTEALKFLDVSAAFTILSVNLIIIALLSQWLLREDVSRTRWIGIAFIFAGVALVIARTFAERYTDV
jgi:drug/metabolite transporter (DMT)-like permease